ncbi:MAG: VTT domain-containing protein [Candidatus Aminicenantes bacterium]|nr:MAG: VTT domain-containing protein [Candidatus Aminicenantes bacterium]
MKSIPDTQVPSSISPRGATSRTRTIVFILEIGLILAILIAWLSSESIRQSKSLWILFFYNFPSQFLIAIVPHEPVFLYFSKFYSPLSVTFVAIVGTSLAEVLNYSVFKYVGDLKPVQNVHTSKIVNKLITLFNKAPFAALLIAGFTPVPFYPFRFLVVLARYPLLKYILAIILSRTPRFYLLALFGYTIKIPDYLLPVIFIILTIPFSFPMIKKLLEKQKE